MGAGILGWAVSTPLCVFATGATSTEVRLVPFPSSTPLRCVNLVWMSERGGGPARLVSNACNGIFEDLIIAELRARAPGLEERVTLAQ